MRRVGRTRVAVLLVGGLAGPAIAGCGGGSDFKDKPRPPVPIQLTGAITDKSISVQPDKVGAGPVTLIIANLSDQSHTVTLEGGPKNISEQVGPINPQDNARIQETLQTGTYTISAGSGEATLDEIQPAELHVGAKRKSSSDRVLLP
jgi:hypothetical protein